MRFRATLSLPVLLAFFATLAQASNVRADYDHNVNFSTLHTYSWGTVKTSDPLVKSRLKAAVDQELQARGWQMVPSGGNVTVFATDNVKNEQQLETMYDGMGGGMGGGWGWGGWGGGWGGGGIGEATTSTQTQRVGDLVLDIFSGSSHKLLFRGVAEEDLSNHSSKNTKNMDKDISDMFKKFPVKGKS